MTRIWSTYKKKKKIHLYLLPKCAIIIHILELISSVTIFPSFKQLFIVLYIFANYIDFEFNETIIPTYIKLTNVFGDKHTT